MRELIDFWPPLTDSEGAEILNSISLEMGCDDFGVRFCCSETIRLKKHCADLIRAELRRLNGFAD
jgi:hypothetical protein